jgi:hypothetical protein
MTAYCHLLIILIQLQFETVPLMVFHDTFSLTLPTKATPNSPFADLYFKLSEEFSKIEFTPTPKGPQIKRLRTKLKNLANIESNEILTTSLTEIAKLIHSGQS